MIQEKDKISDKVKIGLFQHRIRNKKTSTDNSVQYIGGITFGI